MRAPKIMRELPAGNKDLYGNFKKRKKDDYISGKGICLVGAGGRGI